MKKCGGVASAITAVRFGPKEESLSGTQSGLWVCTTNRSQYKYMLPRQSLFDHFFFKMLNDIYDKY